VQDAASRPSLWITGDLEQPQQQNQQKKQRQNSSPSRKGILAWGILVMAAGFPVPPQQPLPSPQTLPALSNPWWLGHGPRSMQ
jgi:hypothetical protein